MNIITQIKNVFKVLIDMYLKNDGSNNDMHDLLLMSISYKMNHEVPNCY